MSVYTDIKEKSFPIIESYHDDLVKHDKRWITDNPGVPFVHYTRIWGTHLISFDPVTSYPGKNVLVPYMFGRAGRDRILRGKMESGLYFDKSNQIKLIQYFDGSTIKTIKKPAALKLMQDYTRLMYREFSKAS